MQHLPKFEKADLRVMTANLLFDATAPERESKILENLAYYQPDIIGFQEINRFYRDSFIPKFEAMGYKFVTAQPDPEHRRESELRSLSKKYPTLNYFPIAYRADRFEEVESLFLMYTSTYTQTKGMTAAVLRDKTSGRLIGHINTHAALILRSYGLDGMSDRVDGAVWRADNARQMLEEQRAINEKYGDIPFFFTGDFNGGEEEEFYRVITESGMRNSKYAAKVGASLGQFTYHAVIGALPDNKRTPIDHIFVSTGVDVWVHSIETRREVLEASDHCMVYADVSI